MIEEHQEPTDLNSEKQKENSNPIGWAALGIIYFFFAFTYSVIQPLTALPDEKAHMDYVIFLSDEKRLPHWDSSGVCEGGYETQHPPFAYFIQSIAYNTSEFLTEPFRWYAVRWWMLLIGLLLLPLTAKISRMLYNGDEFKRLVFASTIMLMPLSLMYLTHANPDGIGMILSSLALLLGIAILKIEQEQIWMPWLAGLISALATLTKLSAAPIGLMLLAFQFLRAGQTTVEKLKNCGVILLVWMFAGGWWYARNWFCYGSLFVHTEGKFGTGLDLAQTQGTLSTFLFTFKETFLSSWAQRGWFPESSETIIYGVIILFILLTVLGYFFKGKDGEINLNGYKTLIPADKKITLWLALILTVAVFAGHQLAFWTVDVEFNAGGRYMLIALPAVALLITSGIGRFGLKLRTNLYGFWLGMLFVMNLVSMYNILYVLTPLYYPDWQIWTFPR